jgi:transposase
VRRTPEIDSYSLIRIAISISRWRRSAPRACRLLLSNSRQRLAFPPWNHNISGLVRTTLPYLEVGGRVQTGAFALPENSSSTRPRSPARLSAARSAARANLTNFPPKSLALSQERRPCCKRGPAQPPDKPAQPPDKPAQPGGEPGHQPHAPVELTDQELELLDQPIELPIDPTPFGASPARLAGRGPTPARRLVSPQEAAASNRKLTPEQKLLILDTWQRSGLPVTDFAALVGINRATLYGWKKRFEELGPAGLGDQPRKKPAGKVPDLTKRTILMLKKANPQWGCQRISDVLYRGPGLPASANTVAAILREAGYVLEEQPTTPHPR